MPLHVNDKRSHAYHRLPFLIHSISCSMLNKLSEAPRYDGKFPFTCPLPSLVFCIILYPLETQSTTLHFTHWKYLPPLGRSMIQPAIRWPSPARELAEDPFLRLALFLVCQQALFVYLVP